MDTSLSCRVIDPEVRRRVFVAYALVAVTLFAGTTPVLTGDGFEYIGMTMQMAHLRHPAMTADQAADIEYRLATSEPSFRHFDLIAGKRSDSSGRYDQTHFWLYSLVAVPAYWLADGLGLHANHAFAVLNLVLLLLGFWVVSSKLDVAGTLLLFAGPVIWYINKAHTEVFTFVLLAVAMTVVKERPWWSMVCFGVASAQASPVAGLVPAAGFLALAADRTLVGNRRFWCGGVAAVGFAALAPFYYWGRYGVLQIIVQELRWPHVQEITAVVGDPTVGLLGNYPVFLLATGVAIVAVVVPRPILSRSPDLWLSLVALALFLPAFAQTNNFNHGAKIGLTRYALWVMPLAIPWMARAVSISFPTWSWRMAVVPLALASCLWSLFAYNPARPEGFGPTRLSAWLWNRYPGWNNPVPEIFTENTGFEEAAPFPAFTANCSKLLLLDGVWPTPCPPAPVPDECRGPKSICYANRQESGYDFVRGGRAFGYPTRPRTRAWPRGAESTFLPWLVDRWWEARVFQAAGGESMVRTSEGSDRLRTYEGDRSLLVYLHGTRPGAIVRLRVPWAATGFFIRPATGQRASRVSGGPVAAGDLWELPIPAAGGDIVLVLSRADVPGP